MINFNKFHRQNWTVFHWLKKHFETMSQNGPIESEDREEWLYSPKIS